MNEEDKELWLDVYTTNLMHYNARVHAYTAGNLEAREMCDQEAEMYAEEHNVKAHPGEQLYVVNELTPTERKMVEERRNKKLKFKPLPPSHQGIKRAY